MKTTGDTVSTPLILFSLKTLSEMSTLVSTTCDAFLNVLAECMDLSFAGGEWFGQVNSRSERTCVWCGRSHAGRPSCETMLLYGRRCHIIQAMPTVLATNPVQNDQPPVWSGQPPVWSDQPPVWSDQPPVWSDQPPVWSGQPPVWSDQPPVWSGQPPVWSGQRYWSLG